MKTKKLVIGFLLTLISSNSLMAQKLQVVSKIVEKTIPYQKGMLLAVNSEKAEIKITGWDKKEIFIKLTMISKHPLKEKAEKGLNDMSYSIEVSDNKVVNVTSKVHNRGPHIRRKVLIDINVPPSCILEIENNFGDITLQNLDNKVDVESNYGDVIMKNIRGVLEIEANFGDISGDRITGNITVNSNYGDIKFYDTEGKFDIDLDFGDIRIDRLKNLHGLVINSSKGDIDIRLESPDKYGYNLETSFGKIRLPNAVDEGSTTSKTGFQSRVINRKGTEVPVLKINSSFGDINIQ